MDKFEVINPYSGDVIGTAPVATPDHIKKVLRMSYDKKMDLSARERSIILSRIAEEIERRKVELAKLITGETGLCLKDSRAEVNRAMEVAVIASKVAETIDDDTTSQYIFNATKTLPKLKVIIEPMSLVIGITPFNHPLNQVAHKLFPAIAAGTCIVLKPSEKTPMSALKLGEIAMQSGLSDNMLNVITGIPAETVVNELVRSPLIDMVSFTGGIEAGLNIKRMMVDGGNGLKKYVPELGGSSSLIVHDDADLRRAAKLTVEGCFKNSGQRCTAIRRVVVNNRVADDFLDLLVNEAKKIKCGDPYDPSTDMGTVINENAAIEIERRVNAAISDGAELIIGNSRKGALYSPTVLDHVSVKLELLAKETFGPVCPVVRVDNIDEAIAVANDTKYRLAGAVVTGSEEIAKRVSDALSVGQFSWNGAPGYRTEAAPFGGFMDSGNGEKEGVVLAAKGMRRMRTFYQHR